MPESKAKAMRKGRIAVLLGLLAVSLGMAGYAAILPTKGTFKGVYQVNRAGVGSLDFFIIPKALKDRMAPYEGEYIELEIVKARQPINPGPAIVDQVGKIKRLPGAPLAIALEARPSTEGRGGAIDLVYSVTNVGDKEVIFNANSLSVGVGGYVQPELDDAPDQIFQTGYTRRQLSFGESLLQRWNFISPMRPGERTHFYTGSVLLQPGESAPFVLRNLDIKAGQYEMTARMACPNGDERVPVVAARPLDIPLSTHRRFSAKALKGQVKVTYENEWLVVDGRIFCPTGASVSLFTLPDGQHHFLPGLIQLYSTSGDLVPARLDWRRPDGPWRKTRIVQEGLPFRFRIRNLDRFVRTEIGRIGLWTVTDGGIERITLTDDLPKNPLPPLPTWGESVRGCRLRILTPRERFVTGEKIRLHFQAESDGKKADVLWIDEGDFETHVIALVDGKKAPIGTTQICDGCANTFPFQGEITLASLYKAAPGKHTLQLSILGNGGTYKNLRGEKFRKLRGKLVSNTVEFEVMEEKE